MSIEESQRRFIECESATPEPEQKAGRSSGSQGLVHRVAARLVRSRLRSELRARPGLQGRVLAPAGTFRRLPRTSALYFPFYHDVPPQYARQLRRHLDRFRGLGPFVTWDDALAILAGDRPLTAPHFCLSFDDGDRTWVDVLAPLLDSLRIPATFFVITDQISQGDRLTWQDCRDLRGAGHSFGSHTRSHRRLADLDDATATGEIRDSKAEIEDQLGVAVRDFAAPYGWPERDYTDRHVEMARAAGYRSFASTFRTAMQPGDSPMFVHRQGLHPAWPLRAVMTRVHE
jgi:peptidoglycan/xylan/chitin deacetylase (PgdA/CDA1 family)